MPINLGNIPAQGNAHVYTPTLTGATDNPVATYGTQVGTYQLLSGQRCRVDVTLTTTTMTKTTLTDLLQITLPFTAATRASQVWTGAGRVENGTAVANALRAEIASGASVVNFRNYAALATAGVQTTYQVANPGIGVLTNTITYNFSIEYEIA